MADKDSLAVLHVHFVPASIGDGGCYSILRKRLVQCVRRTGVNPLTLACVVFAIVVSGIFTGMLLRRLLPEDRLSDDSKEVIRLGAGLIATINSPPEPPYSLGERLFRNAERLCQADDRRRHPARPRPCPIRSRSSGSSRGTRQSLERMAAQIWSEKAVRNSIMPFQATIGEQTIFKIQELAPQNDMQRSPKT